MGCAVPPGMRRRLASKMAPKTRAAHSLVQHQTGLVHDFAARPLQHFHQGIGHQHQQCQHGQREVAAAVHHTVIDLQHVAAGRSTSRLENRLNHAARTK
jgi:hypothetical protein